MARRLTTTDLVSQVRSLIDEVNQENVYDTLDIIPALNRAQDYAANLLAKHYEAPLLTNIIVTKTTGNDLIPVPEQAFEQRVEKVEVKLNGYYIELQRIDYRDISAYETSGAIYSPLYYAIIADDIKIVGNQHEQEYRIWYLDDPRPLVKEQGRVAVLPTSGNYVIVQNLGHDITQEQESLDSYVNWVDGTTGKIKATLQVQSIVGDKITFKTTPDRAAISGLSVTGARPANAELDDYLCVADGTCISILRKPFSNFLVQYAVAEISVLKLGGPAEAPTAILARLERQVEGSWVGREQTLRVKKRNRQWSIPSRRFSNLR